MSGKREIESYTANELALAVIKHLRRIGDAIEAQTEAFTEAHRAGCVDVSGSMPLNIFEVENPVADACKNDVLEPIAGVRKGKRADATK